MGLQLTVLAERLAVSRLAPEIPLPLWATNGSFWSVTRTPDELSIVALEVNVPPDATAERGWRAFKVAGPLDFALTGILALLAGALAEAGISLFAVSTFDTDYILVKEARLADAVAVLRATGHQVDDGNRD